MQGWNKKWDEWVEETGLTKYNKDLAKMEFTQEGEGGTKEFGANVRNAEAHARSGGEAGSSKKAEKSRKLTAHGGVPGSTGSKVGILQPCLTGPSLHNPPISHSRICRRVAGISA